MKKKFRYMTVLLFSIFIVPRAQSQTHSLGPIHMRNQFPAALPFLAHIPDDATLLHRGQVRLGVGYSHANTFVKSQPVVDAVKSQGSRVLTRRAAEDLIASSPDTDEFLLDLASEYLSFRASYGFSDRINLSLSLPIILYHGGFLDHFIENFHSSFGLPHDNRPEFVRNATQAFFYLNGEMIFFEPGKLSHFGVGDLVIAGKLLLFSQHGATPSLSATVLMKAPTGNPDQLRGSGSFDFGATLHATRRFSRHALHLGLGIMRPGRWVLMPAVALPPVHSMLAALEFQLGRRTFLIVQDFGSDSIFRKITETRIARFSHEITFGLKIAAAPGIIWSFSATENYVNFRNTPDIGFHMGVERLL